MKNILVIGSGGLRVGQAGEFDYSGSQAIKAFKSDGHNVILVNPNIATVQTDSSMADKTYFVPLQLQTVSSIIKQENIQLLALGFGGQTALNLGIELYNSGILPELNIEVLGSPVHSINLTENRELFRDTLIENNINTPKSLLATTLVEAIAAADKIGYPLMLRSGFSLGGLGSGKIKNQEELITRVSQVLAVTPHVLLEEYLVGWKEFEYEIVRDKFGNALTICNMENLDPMGIHTGDSIVVAPAQTLNDQEHQQLRDIALKCAHIFGIIGECNIQFALNPENGEYRVIEMNPRLSRSSALASKATGYPLAYVAAKLCLGHALYEVSNQLTGTTCAFFEPALDYVIVKIPRFDTQKMELATRQIGSEMKSVGEVMGIGRSFHEALQKAVQMLNIGASCLLDYPYAIIDLADELEYATDRRIFALYQWFESGNSVEGAHQLSKIDYWFLNRIYEIAQFSNEFARSNITTDNLLQAKQFGLSDRVIGKMHNLDELSIRELRKKFAINPYVKQIDTVAGEFKAQSNYLYMTYHATSHDLLPSVNHICILGSGPYAIGSSVEFDWCTVNLAREFRRNHQDVIIINSNPETVSTDYDESNRLYFEPLSFERVADILDFEHTSGVVVNVGGQSANNLVVQLSGMDYPILGTAAENIHQAEDRQLFSQLLHDANIDQPRWSKITHLEQDLIRGFNFPLIIRPSYVLSGAAMKVVTNPDELSQYFAGGLKLGPNNSLVISEFIEDAQEIEVDGVAANGTIIFMAISEHIENAGVHSGDATLIYPAQSLSEEIRQRITRISSSIAQKLSISGPFNLQLLLKDGSLKVIECNVRASRSFPFISKVSGCNLIQLVAQVLLNLPLGNTQVASMAIGVKTPVFSYNRFKGCDPVPNVEMASTGEVACIGTNLSDTFYQSWQAVGQTIGGKRVLITIPVAIIAKFKDLINALIKEQWHIIVTDGAYNELIPYCSNINFSNDGINLIKRQEVDLVINIPPNIYAANQDTEQFALRRHAIDYHIPLVTNLHVARLLLTSLIN